MTLAILYYYVELNYTSVHIRCAGVCACVCGASVSSHNLIDTRLIRHSVRQARTHLWDRSRRGSMMTQATTQARTH